MSTKKALSVEVQVFLLMVALGNTEPDILAKNATELLKASGTRMDEIAKRQYLAAK